MSPRAGTGPAALMVAIAIAQGAIARDPAPGTIDLPIEMAITGFAAATSTPLDFGNLRPDPAQPRIAQSRADGFVRLARGLRVNLSVDATAQTVLDCPTGPVRIDTKAGSPTPDDCTRSDAPLCRVAISGTATIPPGQATGGSSCASGSASITVTYGSAS